MTNEGREQAGAVQSDVIEIGGAEPAPVSARARALVVERSLGLPSPRRTLVRLGLTWGPGVAAALVGLSLHRTVVWVAVWVVEALAFVASAGVTHEAAHGHLFFSKAANTAIGALATATLFGSFATYRAYHLEHHARTAQPGDPEGTPLNFSARWQYVAVMCLGGLAVLLENTSYSLLTLLGRPPRWARTGRQRRAIRANAVLLGAVIAAAVLGMLVDPAVTLRVWLIPDAFAVLIVLPLLLLPEHYGATGAGNILDNTRSVRSNPLVRWVFWNNNFHAAHHLVPVVPYDKITLIDELLEDEPIAAVWRTRSYTAFAWGTVADLAFNRPKT